MCLSARFVGRGTSACRRRCCRACCLLPCSQVADIEAAEKEKMKEKCEKIVAHGINCFVNRQVSMLCRTVLGLCRAVLGREESSRGGIWGAVRSVTPTASSTARSARKGGGRSGKGGVQKGLTQGRGAGAQPLLTHSHPPTHLPCCPPLVLPCSSSTTLRSSCALHPSPTPSH